MLTRKTLPCVKSEIKSVHLHLKLVCLFVFVKPFIKVVCNLYGRYKGGGEGEAKV